MIEGIYLCPTHGIFLKGDPKATGINELRIKVRGQVFVITDLDEVTIKHTDKCPKCPKKLGEVHVAKRESIGVE